MILAVRVDAFAASEQHTATRIRLALTHATHVMRTPPAMQRPAASSQRGKALVQAINMERGRTPVATYELPTIVTHQTDILIAVVPIVQLCILDYNLWRSYIIKNKTNLATPRKMQYSQDFSGHG